MAGNAMIVLEGLYYRPFISINQVASLTGVSFPAASSLMSKFVEHGLLTEVTGQARNRRFQYSPYVQIFATE